MPKKYLTYSSVQINRTEIPQRDLNIEIKERSNLFKWRGQFSPQFIETLLNNYAKEDDIIFDPFLGSGTILYEACRKNISAFGTELNVSAFYMSKIYEISNMPFSERVLLVSELENILKNITLNEDIIPSIIDYISSHSESVSTNIMCTLVIILDVFNNQLSLDILNKKWKELKSRIMGIPYSSKKIFAIRGDARNTSFPDDSATCLITSPPYINVFNYHQKYRRSVEILGYDVLKIAKCEFGSNRKNRGNRFLTIIQDCIDMAFSILEAIRVCKNKARMIYVVGRESMVLGYTFSNSRLIYEICTEIFKLPFVIRQERVFKNRYGQMIYEDILHFRNNKEMLETDKTNILDLSRNIAVKMLNEKIKLNSDNKNYNLILKAATEASKVKESKV